MNWGRNNTGGPVVPARGPRDNTRGQRRIALTLLVILATAFGFLGGYFGDQASENPVNNEQVQQQAATTENELISRIAKDTEDSVVSITVTAQGVQQTLFGDLNVRRQSAGTGIILDSNGTIITNRHVIPAGTTSVTVTLADGTVLEDVDVIGRTAENDTLDIAFLRVTDKKGKELKPAKLGDSSKIEVGHKVVAIGNALGQFQNTVTAGILSGYGRSVEAEESNQNVETLQNLFQTDASINEGNSGGPLLNTNGEVIGINVAVAGNAENIGFAIPINDVQGLIKSVLKEGKLLRPYLGIRYVSINDEYAFELSLPVKRGAYVVPNEGGQPSILPDSPAADAGLQEKDIIMKVNGEEINEKNSLTSALGQHSVGDKITLTIIRDGKEQTVEVTLEASPQ